MGVPAFISARGQLSVGVPIVPSSVQALPDGGCPDRLRSSSNGGCPDRLDRRRMVSVPIVGPGPPGWWVSRSSDHLPIISQIVGVPIIRSSRSSDHPIVRGYFDRIWWHSSIDASLGQEIDRFGRLMAKSQSDAAKSRRGPSWIPSFLASSFFSRPRSTCQKSDTPCKPGHPPISFPTRSDGTPAHLVSHAERWGQSPAMNWFHVVYMVFPANNQSRIQG